MLNNSGLFWMDIVLCTVQGRGWLCFLCQDLQHCLLKIVWPTCATRDTCAARDETFVTCVTVWLSSQLWWEQATRQLGFEGSFNLLITIFVIWIGTLRAAISRIYTSQVACTRELQTKVREDFTITDAAPMLNRHVKLGHQHKDHKRWTVRLA